LLHDLAPGLGFCGEDLFDGEIWVNVSGGVPDSPGVGSVVRDYSELED